MLLLYWLMVWWMAGMLVWMAQGLLLLLSPVCAHTAAACMLQAAQHHHPAGQAITTPSAVQSSALTVGMSATACSCCSSSGQLVCADSGWLSPTSGATSSSVAHVGSGSAWSGIASAAAVRIDTPLH